MSDTQNVENLISDMAQFMHTATPRIEKLAELETATQKFYQRLAEKMAQAGVIDGTDVPSVVRDMNEGGLSKAAEAIDFMLNRIKETPRSFGKASSVQSVESEPLTSDAVFEKRLGL